MSANRSSYPLSLDSVETTNAVIAECSKLHTAGSQDPNVLVLYMAALLSQQDWMAARFLAKLHAPALGEWYKVAHFALNGQVGLVIQQLQAVASVAAQAAAQVQQQPQPVVVQGLDASLAALIPTYCRNIAEAYQHSILQRWANTNPPVQPPDYYRVLLGETSSPSSWKLVPDRPSMPPTFTDSVAFLESTT